jgi:hypothetical protein
MKRNIKIETPTGFTETSKTKNGTITTSLKWNAGFGKKWSGQLMSSQEYIDSEVLRRCEKYIPLLTGVLIKSGILNTTIGSGEVVWKTPYARRQYYENKGKGNRGKMWFERMKIDNKKSILEGANKIAKGE